MRLEIVRTRNTSTDRRGNVKSVSFSLRFSLKLTAEEQSIVRDNALESESLFQSQARFVVAREAIAGSAEWTGLPLASALSIQGSMIDNCRGFAALVRTAAGFDGTHEIELSAS
jgi:hypothetical protein